MCLIINKPKGAEINEDWITNSFTCNKDGWGVMWSNGKKVIVEKGFKLEPLKDCLKKLDRSLHIAVHMRSATSGEKDLENCHPIKAGNVWVMHNGIIQIPQKLKKWSDTKHFSEFVVKPMLSMYPGMFGSKNLIDIYEYFIGVSNKLLLMRGDGDVMIVNEKGGTWQDKCWLSNTYSITNFQRSTNNYTQRPTQGNCGRGVTYYHGNGECYGNWSTKETDKVGQYCEACKVFITQSKDLWIKAPGLGWVCQNCWDKLEDDLPSISDISLDDLFLLDYTELSTLCEEMPETIAWIILVKGAMRNELKKEGIKLLEKSIEKGIEDKKEEEKDGTGAENHFVG